MARRVNHEFERCHEVGESTRLASVLLDDGVFEAVEGWTPVDEVIASEGAEVDLNSEHLILVPVEHYDLMLGAAELHGIDIADEQHVRVRPGTLVLEPEELQTRLRKAKLDTFMALMRYVWWNSANLWGAMRNLLAITHKISPGFIRGMSGTDIGKLLGVCRAAFNKHEIKLVVEYLEKWGVKGGTAGGSKPAGHRDLKSAQMQGRRHRAHDYEPNAGDSEMPVMTQEQKRRADELWHASERRRVAALAGVAAEDIDLQRTNPNNKRKAS